MTTTKRTGEGMAGMGDRLALVIGVEGPPGAAYAESDASAFARALEPLGFARGDQVVLLGGQATRTAVESRLRKLARNPPAADTLVAYYAGPGFGEAGRGYLGCPDTQADDLAETGVPVPSLLDALAGSGCRRLLLFLDPRPGLGAGAFPTAELERFFAGRPEAACFLSCAPGEASHVSGSLKAGAWAHLAVEALAGRAPRALEAGRLL